LHGEDVVQVTDFPAEMDFPGVVKNKPIGSLSLSRVTPIPPQGVAIEPVYELPENALGPPKTNPANAEALGKDTPHKSAVDRKKPASDEL
jgi:hypothetical protein